MIKNILLAGATGFLGSHLLAVFVKEKYNIMILKRSFSNIGRIESFLNKVKVYDIDQTGIQKPFTENSIDLVINLATDYGRKKGSKLSELVTANIVFPLELIENACKNKVPYFFNTDTFLDENVNFYAQTKKIAKKILKENFVGKIKIIHLRPYYMYGPKDDISKFIPYAATKLKNNETLETTEGQQAIDFVHVQDCAEAIVHIIRHIESYQGYSEEVEIGTGQPVKLKEVLELLKKKFHSTSKINYGAISYRENEQMTAKADLTKLKGWQPRFSWEDMANEL